MGHGVQAIRYQIFVNANQEMKTLNEQYYNYY